LNFHDLHDFKQTLSKFKETISHKGDHQIQTGNPEVKSALKRFFRYEDKLLWLTPFSYSNEREKTGGFNDEEHFLLNSKTKVHVHEYFDMSA